MGLLKAPSAAIVIVLAGLLSGCQPTDEPDGVGTATESAARFVGTWTGPDGEPASDGDPIWDDELIVQTGPDHCDWTSVVFMSIAWPPGTSYGDDGDEWRQFVRDPEGVLPNDKFTERLELDADLPDGSTDTGYSNDGLELWLGDDRGDDAAYLVTDERVERWPRATEPVGCD